MITNKIIEEEIKKLFKKPEQKKLAVKLARAATSTKDLKEIIDEFINKDDG